jgi:hypothetical protein
MRTLSPGAAASCAMASRAMSSGSNFRGFFEGCGARGGGVGFRLAVTRSPDPRRPAPQIEAGQDRQNTDDDPNFLCPSEARIAPETQGIGEERDRGNETPIRASADVLDTAISPLFDHLIGPEQEGLSLTQGCVRAPGPTQSRAVVRFW